MSYFEELQKFLDQAKKDDLKTSKYLKIYKDLEVRVGFGNGNSARVPWIAFLKKPNVVQKGIYPGYLYFKSKNLLILSYCVSETENSNNKWNITEPVSISSFFSKRGLGMPYRYGSSFVFKSYDTTKELNKEEVDKDLNEIITSYKKQGFTDIQNNLIRRINLSEALNTKSKESVSSMFNYKIFLECSKKSNFQISQDLCLRYIASLLSKPFVILTGLSGSGKTKLAQAFVEWLCEDKSQFCIVPVGADWTNREPLLGFPNSLTIGTYVKPDNRVLDTIIAATNDSKNPYFLILDEMNLSHVERYFADFLSTMESGDEISLHAGNDEWNDVPAKISLPKNLFVVGTVNIDETTYMFSPKVLDRANVIEFRVTAEEMKSYLKEQAPLSLNVLERQGISMAADFIQIANNKTLSVKDDKLIKDELINFFTSLKVSGAEFGYRSAAEILRFAGVVNLLEPSWSKEQILDAAIMQKLLPKVHGSRRKLEPVLKTLGKLCFAVDLDTDKYFGTKVVPDAELVKYPISLEKILRMYNGLIDNGFTSYAEA